MAWNRNFPLVSTKLRKLQSTWGPTWKRPCLSWPPLGSKVPSPSLSDTVPSLAASAGALRLCPVASNPCCPLAILGWLKHLIMQLTFNRNVKSLSYLCWVNIWFPVIYSHWCWIWCLEAYNLSFTSVWCCLKELRATMISTFCSSVGKILFPSMNVSYANTCNF